jgi:beta-phosphoglucomutase-like phosphatase (HAD superfamily)
MMFTPANRIPQFTNSRLSACPPDKLLALEDAPSGVQAARSAGMKCVGISTDGRANMLRRCGTEFAIPDLRSDSIEMLMTLVSDCSV